MCGYENILKNGNGIEQNYSEAIKYYKMAITLGNSSAMNIYAFMLGEGEGVECNRAKAMKYYKMSADKGNKIGMRNYAQMLENEKEN